MSAWSILSYGALLGCALWAPLHAMQVSSSAPHINGAAPQFVAQGAPVDLPPNDQAQALIDGDPSVVQARHALEAARLRAGMLTAGRYEWTARASTQRRRYRSGTPDVNEWSAGIERALRIGGKAALDRQLGEAEVRLAQARLGEARHEAARALLDLWLEWLTAARSKPLWIEQLGFAQANVTVAGKRRRAGDASLLEQNTALADLAEVQRQLSTASTAEAKARARLLARFPQVVLQTAPPGEPLPLVPDVALWRQRILAESDVIRIVEEDLRRAELAAARARAERMPDPTIGVHATSEAGGAERIVGFSLSMPLGSTYRDAQGREALKLVEAARAAVDVRRGEIDAEIGANLADVQGSLERWQFAEQATSATRDNARLTQRAYVLGESDLQTVLLARRQLVEASLGASQARLDALTARYKLLVDAHLIWGLHDE